MDFFGKKARHRDVALDGFLDAPAVSLAPVIVIEFGVGVGFVDVC